MPLVRRWRNRAGVCLHLFFMYWYHFHTRTSYSNVFCRVFCQFFCCVWRVCRNMASTLPWSRSHSSARRRKHSNLPIKNALHLPREQRRWVNAPCKYFAYINYSRNYTRNFCTRNIVVCTNIELCVLLLPCILHFMHIIFWIELGKQLLNVFHNNTIFPLKLCNFFLFSLGLFCVVITCTAIIQ